MEQRSARVPVKDEVAGSNPVGAATHHPAPPCAPQQETVTGRWGILRRATAVATLALVLLAGIWAWPTIDAYARATALLGDAVLRLPVQPLT